MSTSLTLRTSHRPDGRAVLTADGEIDISNLSRFRAALADAVAGTVAGTVADTAPTVVDLTAVTYLDSGAINAMFAYAEQLHLLCNPLVLRTLKISGLADVVHIETPDTGL